MTGMLFLISAAVMITLIFRPLYQADVKYLHLSEETGYSEKQIMDNYRELIRYNVSPFHDKLEFPDFPMSEEGEIHFREVKRIFQMFLYLMIVTFSVYLTGILRMKKKRNWEFLKYTGIFSILIPCFAGILVAVNWEWVFITFHKLVFRNDYWLFDPATDPVILVLPDLYFMHCAILIFGIIASGAVISLVFYWKKAGNQKNGIR